MNTDEYYWQELKVLTKRHLLRHLKDTYLLFCVLWFLIQSRNILWVLLRLTELLFALLRFWGLNLGLCSVLAGQTLYHCAAHFRSGLIGNIRISPVSQKLFYPIYVVSASSLHYLVLTDVSSHS